MEDRHFEEIVAEYAAKYPPLINVNQAVEISHAPIKTIRHWRHIGLLDGIVFKRGRLRFDRDGFVRFLLKINN